MSASQQKTYPHLERVLRKNIVVNGKDVFTPTTLDLIFHELAINLVKCSSEWKEDQDIVNFFVYGSCGFPLHNKVHDPDCCDYLVERDETCELLPKIVKAFALDGIKLDIDMEVDSTDEDDSALAWNYDDDSD
jgi:hypothetical protein